VTRRRSSPRSLLALGAAAILLVVAPVPAAAAGPGRPAPALEPARRAVDPAEDGCDAVPGRVLVTFSSQAGASEKAAARTGIHGRSLHAYRLPGLELLSTSLPVGTAVGLLRSKGSIVSAEPDCRVQASKTPNDEFFASDQWALRNTNQLGDGVPGKDIDTAAGWNIRTDASTIPVAIIDNGIVLDHPDLAGNLWTNPGEIAGNGVDDDHNGYVDDVHGWDFVNDDPLPADDNGHGTHVAGIIGARGNNGIGVAGVAWTASLMPLKVLDASGSGDDAAIIAALEYAAANGARITNNSYGGAGFDPSLHAAFVEAGDAGMLQLVAAGNAADYNDVVPDSPGGFRLDSVISVAATDDTDALADFSNFGRTTVDIGAPGVDIASTWLSSVDPFSQYAFDSGTSMATPMVSGVAALVAAQNPAWSPAQLRDWILGTARSDPSLSGKTVTGGVVDLGRALGKPTFTAKVSLTEASDTGVSHTDRVTNADPLVFDVTFPRSVTGLQAGDFTRSGTATGCVVAPPTGSGGSRHVSLTGCSSGTVTLTLVAGSVLDAKSTAGPLAASSTTVTVDHAAPGSSGLAIAPLTATALSGSSLRLHATWTGSDAGGAGIDRYQLQSSTTGGTTWTTVSTTLASPAANVLAASTGTVRYRARAVDKAGNVGGWLTGPNTSVRLVQNTSTAVTFGSGWSTASSTTFSGGSVRYSTVAGKAVSYRFTGRSIAFVTTRATTRGKVKIYLDGIYQVTLDLGGSTLHRDVAWQRTWATSATRTVRLVVVGTSGRPRVDLDAFAVVS